MAHIAKMQRMSENFDAMMMTKTRERIEDWVIMRDCCDVYNWGVSWLNERYPSIQYSKPRRIHIWASECFCMTLL
jgi:hypothetical protein